MPSFALSTKMCESKLNVSAFSDSFKQRLLVWINCFVGGAVFVYVQCAVVLSCCCYQSAYLNKSTSSVFCHLTEILLYFWPLKYTKINWQGECWPFYLYASSPSIQPNWYQNAKKYWLADTGYFKQFLPSHMIFANWNNLSWFILWSATARIHVLFDFWQVLINVYVSKT